MSRLWITREGDWKCLQKLSACVTLFELMASLPM
jgi:hypothetical protein